MKQNKKYLVVFLCILLLASFLSLSAFADSSASFSTSKLPFTSSVDASSSLVLGYGPDNGSGPTTFRASCTSDNDIYVFSIPDSNTSGKVNFVFVTSTNSSGSLFLLRCYGGGNSVAKSDTYSVPTWITSTDSITGLLYRSLISYNNYTYSNNDTVVPYFSTLREGLDAAYDFLNPVPVPSPGYFAQQLQPGYVGYFDISGLSDVSVVLGTTLFSGAKFPGFSTSQATGTVTSLPVGSFSLPITGTTPINWGGSGQKNLIGQYSNFSYRYDISSTGSSTWLVVVNPLSGSASGNTALSASASNRNNPITVLINKCRQYKVYSLTETVEIGTGSWSESTESNGNTWSGEYDSDSGTWQGVNDQTGMPQDMSDAPVGGGNDPVLNGHTSVSDFLQDIANTIKGFFTGAIGAVTTLVSAGQSFFNVLIGLYGWLPVSVLSVLTSALILVITIGFIKVFL